MSTAMADTGARATGVDAIYYSVKDVARAIAFYRELLDVREVTWENEHGAEFILSDGTAFGVGAYSSGDWAPSGCVLFSVPDLDAAAPRIELLGGKLVDHIRDFASCRSQWCEDPDGNSFVLHQRTVNNLVSVAARSEKAPS
ncbi:MAG: VOC family protein [Candidatus Eremiobacteraeota bacterium]|nr:VOC family protein [Candidatus Eremiobacteraeota bacterium]